MRRVVPLVLVLAAPLVVAAPVAAKEVSHAQVCGADGCQDVEQPNERMLSAGALRVTPFPASRLPAGLFPAKVPAHDGSGFDSWWIALVLGPIALALGLAIVRRRRGMGPAAAA